MISGYDNLNFMGKENKVKHTTSPAQDISYIGGSARIASHSFRFQTPLLEVLTTMVYKNSGKQ